jgi:hypothetical protein
LRIVQIGSFKLMDQFYHGSNSRLMLLIQIEATQRMAQYGVPE